MKELYFADQNRYDNGMEYERCGRSGVLLPKVSLGFWHNFGSVIPMNGVVRSPIMPLIMVSPTSIWPTTTDLYMVRLKRQWED